MIAKGVLLTVQTSISAPRRLVAPKQASTRMDTLGGRGNASEGFPGGKDWVEETEDGHTYQQEYGIFVEVPIRRADEMPF